MATDEAVPAADDCLKLLDNGYAVILMKNQLGSYTAAAVRITEELHKAIKRTPERRITDDFTPSKALYRLTEKATTGRIA